MEDMHSKRVAAAQKVSLAVAALAEVLRNQKPIQCPSQPSWMVPIPKRGISVQCGDSHHCISVIESCYKAVSTAYPDCIVRRFQQREVPYFVVYAEFSERSQHLGRGHSECEAWQLALQSLG